VATVFLPPPAFGETGETGIPPWPAARVAPSRTKGLHLVNRPLLRDLDVERYPIFSLTAVETDHENRAMGGRPGQCLTTVRVTSSEAPVL
jgi:hypothetical protein